MLETLREIAPLGTWLRVGTASLLLLLAFVALSHARVARSAYGHPFKGWAAAGLRESMLRAGIALLALGLLLWGWELAWPIALLVALGAVAAPALILEGVGLLRWRLKGVPPA